MKYFGIINEHKPWVRVGVALIGGYVITHGFTRGAWYEIPIGALIILCTLFWKRYVVSEKGVDVESTLCGIVSHSLWKWEDVTSLHTDYHAAHPNVQCHFGRDVVTRTFVFTYDDSQKILELAREKNPNMIIKDMNAEEEERLAENARRYLEKQEAIKAKKKEEKRAKKRRLK